MAIDTDELLEQIAEAASKPHRVKTDAGEFEKHPLKDQIAVFDKVKAEQAGKGRFTFTKLKGGGTV